MEYQPIEILQVEIGKYLDLSGLIAISFLNKSMMEIYQHKIKEVILKIDPFATENTIYDLLHMLRIGNIKSMVFKIYKFLIQQILKEMSYLHPYYSKEKILGIFVDVVPSDAIQELKSKIKNFVEESKLFFIYQGTVYRNYFEEGIFDLYKLFESDLIDIIDLLLHELSERNDLKTEESDMSTTTESDQMDYVPYENIMDSLDTWITTL